MPMFGPVSQRHIDEDGKDRRAPLAKASFEKIHELFELHPEVTVAVLTLYTPAPDSHPAGQPHDTVHTAITAPEHSTITPDGLKLMLDQAIPTLIRMRIMLDAEPEKILHDVKAARAVMS
jgi:hypothetical protein